MRGFWLRHCSNIESFLRFSGRGSVQGVLYDLGSYPGMIAGQGTVAGELYEMLQIELLLPQIDAIEGCYPNSPTESTYLRRRVCVRRSGEIGVSAWTYIFNGTLGNANRILSGDYAAHVNYSRVDSRTFLR